MSFNTIIDWNGCSADQQQQLLTRPAISASDSISKTVTEILNNVKANGDGGFIKLRAVFAQRRVAVGFDVIQDLRHRFTDAVGGGNRRAR